MRLTAFASRNTKEILRDPLTFCFGLGFPVVLLLLLSAINSAIPEQAQMTMFNIDKLTPGITVFGMSFISLFSSMLIAKDRTTSFMMRLFTSPLKAHEFIIGYTLPLLPMAILQQMLILLPKQRKIYQRMATGVLNRHQIESLILHRLLLVMTKKR